MSVTQVPCPNCNIPLPAELINTDGPGPCPSCKRDTFAAAFPALIRPLARDTSAETVVVPDEAACFFHPAKRASIPCDSCGRFLCTLCDIVIEGRHLCPKCLESGEDKGQIETLESSKTRYDQIALALAILPLFLFFITLITAPAALYYCIRYWKTPLSIVEFSRSGFIVAAAVAILELAGWVVVFFNMIRLWNG